MMCFNLCSVNIKSAKLVEIQIKTISLDSNLVYLVKLTSFFKNHTTCRNLKLFICIIGLID